MKYYSTNRQSPVVDFREAALQGQAPDKGLYFPATIPQVDRYLLDEIENLSDEEIAFRVIRPYAGDSMHEETLYGIVADTIAFPIPLVRVNDNIFSLELFHGPTLAFKDVGARFMSRCLGHFVNEGLVSGMHKKGRQKVTVLVATSGDTGGAVANGFYNVEGVEVVILYPSGKVSPVQEKQLTSPGKNIHALEVRGTFDDCQQMVKQAFADKDISQKLFLTSANSINVARWLPQQFYYFFAFKQWAYKAQPPVIAVPSGNFGNICAGLLALRSGLPVKHFIAACNVNDVVSHYLRSQEWIPRQAVPTFSNAMDVGNPSNFIRILELFQHEFASLKSSFSSYTVTDEETLQTIHKMYEEYNYLADPHGAVGCFSLLHYLGEHPSDKGIFLETAHPLKFPAAIKSSTGVDPEIPARLKYLLEQEKKSCLLNAQYSELKNYLLSMS